LLNLDQQLDALQLLLGTLRVRARMQGRRQVGGTSERIAELQTYC
jgi:hypothetical protein